MYKTTTDIFEILTKSFGLIGYMLHIGPKQYLLKALPIKNKGHLPLSYDPTFKNRMHFKKLEITRFYLELMSKPCVCDLCRSCLCCSYPVLITWKHSMDYDFGVLCAPEVFLLFFMQPFHAAYFNILLLNCPTHQSYFRKDPCTKF